MRVLIAAEQLRRAVPGGIGTYTRGLLKGLADLNDPDVDITLFMSKGPVPDGVDVPVLTSKLPGALLTRAWDRGVVGAPADFDVVHSVSLAAPASTAPLSVMVHDVAWREFPDAFPRRGRRWHERALRHAMNRAQLLIVPSRQTATALRDRRVHVVEEGCDHLPPPDHEGAAALLARLDVDGPFVLTVSTLEPRKNLPRVLAAHKQAQLKEPLVVVGPSGWGPELPPQPGVVLAGYVDEAVKAALLAQARCLVYVPVLEGFGLPAVEAMSVGTPVVASPMPSIGEAGLVVDPADTDAIAAALVTATSDDVARQRLVAEGSRRAAALTWSEAARRHVELWRTL